MNLQTEAYTITGWYIIFTTLAGISAIPNDFQEVAKSFRLRPIQKIFSLYLPAIFPYLVTGMISAAGGAWNASIVAEYISYKGRISTVSGIGSTISQSAAESNIPLLVASIVCLVALVTVINYFVWLRIYHYSEKHFSLNI